MNAPAKQKRESDNSGGNALWRIPEWFPDLNGRVMDLLKSYHSELLKFNAKLNLISRNTERDSDEGHFADSILALKAMAGVDLGSRIFDVGSGNGLPGVILAIFEPSREVVLVDADARKCEFLKHIANSLKLANVKIMNVRLESLDRDEVQIAISRGFATITKACLLTNKIFAAGTRYYHLKGNGWSSEIAEIPSQLMSIWKPELVGEYTLPVSQARRAVVCTTKKA